MVLGIDIGGTSLKFGLVTEHGNIVARDKYDTGEFVKNGFEKSMAEAIDKFLKNYPELIGVGIGFPGLLSADRKKVVLLPNIPAVKDVAIVEYLSQRFPKLKIKIENDAKCAALGEYQFGENKGLDNFICVTLGTGVGSGAVINGDLFIGARGNGMEIGHILMGNGKTMEQQIGLGHILEYANTVVKKVGESSMLFTKEITMHALCDAAISGDKSAREVFAHVGRVLGEGMVSVIRVLDVDRILIGGGVSNGFEFILPEMQSTIIKYMPEYYTKNLDIRKASLSNDAGLLGAAGLVMLKHENFGKILS